MPKTPAKKKTATKKTAKPVPKKATSSSKTGKDRPIKYEDKSGGQPELLPVFHELKKLLDNYEKYPLVVRGDLNGQYSLWCDKPVEVAGKMKDVFFAGLLVQKGYVGFYFMPVYANPALKNKLHPNLVKCLKGKSCFHIKKNEPELMLHVKNALKTGYDDFRQKGWV
ncbi:MAG TPA: hypothetical protein VGD17_19510 [Chitinophagaceae bacterium]